MAQEYAFDRLARVFDNATENYVGEQQRQRRLADERAYAERQLANQRAYAEDTRNAGWAHDDAQIKDQRADSKTVRDAGWEHDKGVTGEERVYSEKQAITRMLIAGQFLAPADAGNPAKVAEAWQKSVDFRNEYSAANAAIDAEIADVSAKLTEAEQGMSGIATPEEIRASENAINPKGLQDEMTAGLVQQDTAKRVLARQQGYSQIARQLANTRTNLNIRKDGMIKQMTSGIPLGKLPAVGVQADATVKTETATGNPMDAFLNGSGAPGASPRQPGAGVADPAASAINPARPSGLVYAPINALMSLGDRVDRISEPKHWLDKALVDVAKFVLPTSPAPTSPAPAPDRMAGVFTEPPAAIPLGPATAMPDSLAKLSAGLQSPSSSGVAAEAPATVPDPVARMMAAILQSSSVQFPYRVQ